MKFLVLQFSFANVSLTVEEELFQSAAKKLGYILELASIFDFSQGAEGELYHKGELFPIHEYFVLARPNLLERLDVWTCLWKLFEEKSKGISLSLESLFLCKNKLLTQIHLEKAAIPSPKSILFYGIPSAGALQSLPPAPWVLKRAMGSLGAGVVKIHDEATLKATIQAISPFEPMPFVLQAFIAEANNTDRRLLMLGDQCLVAMERQAQEGEFRANAELGATTKRYIPSPQELDIARQIMKLFSLEFAGIDIIPSSKGPLVLELNCNPGFKTIQHLCDFSIAESVLEYFSAQ